MFLELVIFLISFIFAYDYLSKKRRNEILSYLSGPKPLPIVGNALMFSGKTPEDVFSLFLINRKLYGPTYKMWVFNRVAVFSADPKDIEVVLSSSKLITKNSLYDLLIGWLGEGLLISSGQKWHSRRKVITPTFHFKILEQFTEIFDQQSSKMINHIKEKADGKTAFDIYPFIGRLALDIIAETSMGTKINAQQSPNCGYVQSVSDITSILSKRFIKGSHRINLVFRLIAPSIYKRQQQVIRNLHDFTEGVIKKRRDVLEKQTSDASSIPASETCDEIGSKKRMALLDVLLQSTINGKSLTNDDIREEVDTFMFEGHDTTTNAISFTLYLLSRHPEVQKKAFEEVRDVFGDDRSRSATLQDLNNLKYIEYVIKEGLRLYPPVPIIGRRFSEEVIINGKKIPAGSDFTIGIYIILRDAQYFPNPDAFIPERFIAEKHNPYAYIPFSAGPRNCIGQKFAILEMKSVLSKILNDFELLPLGPEVRPMMNLVLKSANGMHLGLKSRTS